jgi:hypothetical protein
MMFPFLELWARDQVPRAGMRSATGVDTITPERPIYLHN